jgi:hypothetical protein
LFSFAKKEDVTVRTMLLMDNIQEHFHLPLSDEAYDQFCELTAILQSLQLSENNDAWSYIWGNYNFSSQKVYKHLLGIKQFTQCLNGFGGPNVKQSTKFSSGSSYRTDLIPELC